MAGPFRGKRVKMASKRRLRRAACEGKRQYHDKTEAQAAARYAKWRTKGHDIGAYRCAFCGSAEHPIWHIGHQSRRVSLRAA